MVLLRSFKETCLSVSGSDIESSHLDIDLPLPADDNRGILSNYKRDPSLSRIGTALNESTDDVEDTYYLNFVATAGASFIREVQSNTPDNDTPRSIVWRVFQKSRILELDPVDLNSSSKVLFRKIRIHVPVKLYDHCITITEDISTERIVIDFITESNYLYTLCFSFSEFIVKSDRSISDQGHGLNEENAMDWRSIKYPYSFDLKKPHLLYAVSSRELVASTVEGTLVKMERLTPLSDITTFIFNDPSHASGLSRILPWGQNDKVPGHSNLSLMTAVSITSVPQVNMLITLTINRILKIWSLETMKLIEEHELVSSQDNSNLQKILIGPSPMNLLSIPTWKSKYKATSAIYLATYLPLGDGCFKIWQLNLDSLVAGQVLVDLGDDFVVTPQIPDNFSTWLVSDFTLTDYMDTKKGLLLSVMWKSNTSSAMYQMCLPTNPTDEILWYVSCEPEQVDMHYITSEIQQEDKTKYYLEKIFGPDGYTQEIIDTALSIYGSHYALQMYSASQVDTSKQPLLDRVCQTVGTAVSLSYTNDNTLDYPAYNADLSQEWTRFDRLCSELQRQGNEVLALRWDAVLEIFWVVKASFVSVIRPAMPIELCYYNRSSALNNKLSPVIADMLPKVEPKYIDRVLRLVDSIYIFRRNLSYIHFNDIISNITEDFNPKPHFGTDERMLYLYGILIDHQVSEFPVQELHSSLYALGDVDELLEFLYSAISTHLVPAVDTMGSSFTVLGCSTIFKALFEVLTTSRLFISDILLMLLTTLHSDIAIHEHGSLYTKFLQLLKAVNAMLDFMHIRSTKSVFDSVSSKDVHNKSLQSLSLTSSNPLPKSTLPFFQNMMFTEQTGKFNALISKEGFSKALNQIWAYCNISGRSSAASRLIAQLLSTDHVVQAQEMCHYLNVDSFAAFIRAHVFLKNREGSKARTLFRTASVELAQRRLTAEEMDIVRLLGFQYTKHSFGHGIARFFVDVSKATMACSLPSRALQLARDSQLNLSWGIQGDENENPSKLLELHHLVYNNLFESAMRASSYDDAYSALVELHLLNSYESSADDEEELLRTGQVEKIIPYLESLANSMIQSGNGTRLCQYPFIGITDLVSDFFRKKAESALVWATLYSANGNDVAGKTNIRENNDVFLYYQALYSWNIEHHDFRGGKLIYY